MVLTDEQIQRHYLIERELAIRLKNSSKTERSRLYTELYDELFRQVPYHPQLIKKKKDTNKINAVQQIHLISNLLKPDTRFMEIGPGDCSFALAVSSLVKTVIVIDVSNEITSNIQFPPNFTLVVTDGSSIEVPPSSIDVAYSNQLIEHLHPDDTIDHLKNVYNSLTVGGSYVFCTPNRLSGPHDISRYFDNVATGFHLREYTLTELEGILHQIGFNKLRCFVGGRGKYLYVPLQIFKIYEKMVSALPEAVRRRLRENPYFTVSLGINLIATKT